MLARYYKNKFHLPPLPPPDSFRGQTILITGGNTGLGLASAVHCVNLGAASIIITSRDAAKGDTAKASIEVQTGRKAIVRVMHLDMSTLSGVQTFAEQVKRELQSIDFVLLNAGVLNESKRISPDGWEDTIQVNVLSTVLLALLLLPWLDIAGRGRARLAFTGSGMHRGIDIDSKSGWPQQHVLQYWNTEENSKRVGGNGMYAISKLLLIYAFREIALLTTTAYKGVVVSAMCPGFVNTELGRDFMTNPLMTLVLNAFLAAFTKSAAGGARTLIHAGLLGPEENGKYFAFYQSDAEYKLATEKNVWGPQGEKMQKQVWGEILDILQEVAPEVKEIAHLQTK